MQSISFRTVFFSVLTIALLALAGVAQAQVVWPVSGTTTIDNVDKPFGFRVLCGACTDPDDADFHRGIDIKASKGTPVYSVWHGQVVRMRGDDTTSYLPRFGNFVVVALDPLTVDGTALSNHKIAYLHLDSVAPGIAVGTDVQPGTKLGEIGNSGQGINTVHLHFDYYQGSQDQWIRREEARNPLEILPHTSIVPTVTVTKLSDDTLRVAVRQDDDSLDIVGFEVTHDGFSTFHGTDPITIDFNEKDGINMSAPDYEDENPFESTTFLPKYFSKNSSYYELKLDFDGDWSDLTEVTVTLTTANDVDQTFSFDL